MNVLLPTDAKYALIVDTKHDYHHEWGINWSFTYKLDDPNNSSIFLTTEDGEIITTEDGEPLELDVSLGEYGFCTFLTKNPSISSFMLGHYMGFFENLSSLNGEVAIAFDRTGMFALSSPQFPNGVGIDNIIPDSLIIRDSTGVVYNQPLSGFSIPSLNERTIRLRYINKNEISVDYKTGTDLYQNLIKVSITTPLSGNDRLYPAFFYTSPIFSSESPSSTFYLKNFHVQGNTDNPTYS